MGSLNALSLSMEKPTSMKVTSVGKMDRPGDAMLQGRSMDGIPASHNPVLQEVLDLRPYINSSAAAIQESFSLERTYVVFRTLGLRHLVVVDRHNHVKGIVTRKVLHLTRLCVLCLVRLS